MGPIVITGGGTGGHIFPMQAIAQRLETKGVAKADLRYVGSERGQESVLLADDGIELTLLPGRGIRRSFKFDATVENIGAVIGLVRAVALAGAKMRRWRPAAVVSVGGYASFAIALSAVIWRSPLVLVDLDAEPGAAHRLLARFATRRCVAFASDEARTVVTGAPVRDSVAAVDRSSEARGAARRNCDPVVDEARVVVVVMTGSLGSARVNSAVLELAQLWAQRSDVSLWHVTGRRDYESVCAARPDTNGLDYRVLEFVDMAQLWAIADVAVCRAGAVTLAELTVLAIPSILVPLPNAPGDHQTKNALRVANAGGARIIEDASCTGEALAGHLEAVMRPDVRAQMSLAAASIARPDAAGAIADVVLGARR